MFGQGDTPIREIPQLTRDRQLPFQATIEFEYPIPKGSTIGSIRTAGRQNRRYQTRDRVSLSVSGRLRHLSPPPVSADPPRLLCFGRLAPEKGFDIAIDACALLADRFPAIELTIGGTGVLRPDLERRAASRGVADRVRFLGTVPFADVTAMFEAASMVLLPSRSEGFPRVALEAAAHGRPVVAARVGGLPEAVIDGETGVIVDPDDPAALARAVAELLDRPDRLRQFGQAGRRRVVADLSWRRSVDDFVAVYTNVAPQALAAR